MSQILEQQVSAADMALRLLSCYGAAKPADIHWQRLLRHGQAMFAATQALQAWQQRTVCVSQQAFLHTVTQIQAQETLGELQHLHWRYTGLHPIHIHAGQEYAGLAQTLLFTHVPLEQCQLFRDVITQMRALAVQCQENLMDDVQMTLGEHLENAADDLLQAAEWMLQKVVLLQQPSEALSGATPFAKLVAMALGGYALINDAQQQSDITLAQFYAENILTHTRPLSISCTRGSGLLRQSA